MGFDEHGKSFDVKQIAEQLKEIAKSPEEKEEIVTLLSDLSKKPEKRMRNTIENVAQSLDLTWSESYPPDHPYKAQLDGQLFHRGRRVAVVELESRTPKQVRGAILDLITHPEIVKILVIGRSKAVPDPKKQKKELTERVLPILQSLLKNEASLGIFTEQELKNEPKVLESFIGLAHTSD